jgi:hypothetical protein
MPTHRGSLKEQASTHFRDQLTGFGITSNLAYRWGLGQQNLRSPLSVLGWIDAICHHGPGNHG